MEIAGPVVACVADLAFKYAGLIFLNSPKLFISNLNHSFRGIQIGH